MRTLKVAYHYLIYVFGVEQNLKLCKRNSFTKVNLTIIGQIEDFSVFLLNISSLLVDHTNFDVYTE